ncbi:MAG: 2-oxoglutarate dehydrogenase, E2 component, dihydrolipoamide succinyltransferase [Ignavibacteria bacterium]|nr:2-oxoglutarate dehydrogenase, E2 component, dihydrolipoamide succinyltransferase [Ignavibacteria bacterium]
MKVEIVMPKMGESINDGTLIKWHKKKGDLVKKDEIIYEISTDKVDTEIPSPEDGVLVDIKVFEQETVEVGTVVAVIDTNGEAELEESKTVSEKGSAEVISSTTQVGGEIIDIPMPKMGESVMDGTIIKWHKSIGEKIIRDEILFEISTDKVDTEVPSPEDGILVEILKQENETVAVGEAVARISKKGGIVKPKVPIDEKESKPISPSKEVEKTSKDFRTLNKEQFIDHSSNRFYSPLVLNIARIENVSMNELETINGTGIGGRVTKKDIIEFLENRKLNKGSMKFSESKFEESSTTERVRVIPMDNTRQRIMNHMIQSKETSVHVTAINEVDMTVIHNYLTKHAEQLQKNEDIKLTYMSFLCWATIKALREYPLMNASLEGTNIVQKNYINLGIAVAVEPNGLIVPNIKNADGLNIRGLARAIADIANRTRTKKLLPDDVADGTFSITNYGVFGSLFGTPIINQPEVGILGVGAVQKKPVVVDVDGVESIAIKPMMYLSLSHDHRLVDGMLGGKFLKSVKEKLESFDISHV